MAIDTETVSSHMTNQGEYFEIAADASNDDETREGAINSLEAANECNLLAELVRMDDLEEVYRKMALTSLAHPPCSSMLRSLVEEGELSDPYRERAENLLENTPEDSGAGP